MVEVASHWRTGRSPTWWGVWTVSVEKHTRWSRSKSPGWYDVSKDPEAHSSLNNKWDLRFLFDWWKEAVKKDIDKIVSELETRMNIAKNKNSASEYMKLQKQRDNIKSWSLDRVSLKKQAVKIFGWLSASLEATKKRRKGDSSVRDKKIALEEMKKKAKKFLSDAKDTFNRGWVIWQHI